MIGEDLTIGLSLKDWDAELSSIIGLLCWKMMLILISSAELPFHVLFSRTNQWNMLRTSAQIWNKRVKKSKLKCSSRTTQSHSTTFSIAMSEVHKNFTSKSCAKICWKLSWRMQLCKVGKKSNKVVTHQTFKRWLMICWQRSGNPRKKAVGIKVNKRRVRRKKRPNLLVKRCERRSMIDAWPTKAKILTCPLSSSNFWRNELNWAKNALKSSSKSSRLWKRKWSSTWSAENKKNWKEKLLSKMARN